MLEVEQVEQWRGEAVVDRDGEKVGKLEDVYTDAGSGEPVVASISSGFMGRNSILVPLEGATLSREYLRLAISEEQLKDAPEADESEIDRDLEVAMFRHYDKQPPEESETNTRGMRYESSELRNERESKAGELRERAEELEQRARERDEDASSAGSKISDEQERKQGAESERDEASEEAERLRLEADEAER